MLAALLLRRLGPLPLLALALAGRSASPSRRILVLTAAAGVYLGALLALVLLVIVLVGGLALVAVIV